MSTKPLRLFLVENDEDIALLIRKCLERAGHQLSSCRTGADALIVLAHQQFDLVLLDHILPDTTGLELLRQLGQQGISVPALIVTAFGNEQLATSALQSGALDYVVKDSSLGFLAELPKRVSESVTRYRLEQMNRLLIAAIESARDGIMITDLQGIILHVNSALEQMTGFSRQEMIGQTPRILRSEYHGPEIFADLWRKITARSSWQGELTNRRKDGSSFPVSLTVSPILDGQGQLTHFVGIHRDIADRKHLEGQLLQAQKMQSVGTLAGGVAHEFNNLLAGINGYAALALREPGVPQGAHEFLEQIVQLSERAAQLTRQLLAFARKPALQKEQIRIGEAVKQAMELVHTTLHLNVTQDLQEVDAEGRPLLVEADSNQLQQALINLALNARDATTEAARNSTDREFRPAVVCRMRHFVLDTETPAFPQNLPPGNFVGIEISDNGVGMTPLVLSQALDPFFTTKDVGQGTGLGLSLVFGIVQGHQGHLTLESTPGSGTRVGMYLPRHFLGKREEHGQVGFERAEVLAPEQQSGQRILVIDDESAVLDVVKRFLEIAGHQVTPATRGKEACEKIDRGEKFDMAILDLMIPGEESVDTFQRMRQSLPGLPVLLCTGLPQDQPSDLLTLPKVGILHKPFRMNELWHAVRQLLLPDLQEHNGSVPLRASD